jgi:argininosuccinate lyase
VFNLSRLSLFPICHTQLAYCKIPIKNQLDKWRRIKETTDWHISPLGLMCLQGEEMKIDVKNIEEEFQFHGIQAQGLAVIFSHHQVCRI